MFEADEAAEGKGISASSFFPPDSFQRERRRKVKQIPQDLFTHRHHFNLRQPWQKLGKSYRHNSFLNFKPLQKKAALLSEQRGGKGNSLQSSMTSSPLVILLNINMCQPLQHDLEWFCPPHGLLAEMVMTSCKSLTHGRWQRGRLMYVTQTQAVNFFFPTPQNFWKRGV